MAVPSGFTLSAATEFESYTSSAVHNVDLIVTIRAPPSKDGERAAISLGAVLDRSGSMSGNKIALLRETGKFMVQQLSGHDRLGVVTYDSQVAEIMGLQVMDGTGKVLAANKISGLRTGDFTNLSGGLFKGIQQQQELEVEETPGPSRAVMLFTDGLANKGVTDPDKLIATLQKLLDRKPSVKVHTLGFGEDHNEKMLQDIATAGQGIYYFIEKEDEIPKAFADALGGLTSVMAQNAELTVTTVGDDVFIESASSGFKVQDATNGGKLVTFGDLYAEERKDILVRLKVPKLETPVESFPLLDVKLSYMDVTEGMIKHVGVTLAVGRPAEVPGDRRCNPDVVHQRERIESVEALARATEEADRGNLEAAMNIIRNRRVALQSIRDLSREAQDLVSDLEEAETMFEDRKTYTSYGSKKLRTVRHCHSYQRSSGPASAMRYANTVQMRMVGACSGGALPGGLDQRGGSAFRNAVSEPRQQNNAAEQNHPHAPQAQIGNMQMEHVSAGRAAVHGEQEAQGGEDSDDATMTQQSVSGTDDLRLH